MGKVNLLCKLLFRTGTKATKVPLKAFNKAGNRILTKEFIPLNSKALKCVDVPLNTNKIERLVVEKQLGQNSVEVISFKDESGKLIGRLRKDYQNNELINYSSSRYNICSAKINTEEGNGLLRIGDKQTQIFDSSGNLKAMDRIKTDIVKFDNQSSKHVSRMRYQSELKAEGNFEGKFSVSHKFGDSTTNAIDMNVTHSAEGKLLDSKLNNAVNISDKLLSDPYLVTRAMPDEFAVKNLSDRFLNIYDHSNKNLDILFLKGKDTLNRGGSYSLGKNIMTVSLEPSLSHNINTVSHELRHKKQQEYVNIFWKQLWYKLTRNKNFNEREFKLASYFKAQDIKYNVLPHNHLAKESSGSFKRYRYNGLETDAYKKGYRYESDYLRKTEEFKKHFPYISVYNRGAVSSGLTA